MTAIALRRGWGIRRRTESAALTLTVLIVLGLAATQSVQAQTFTVLHNFTGDPDGAGPYAGVSIDAKGNLYGTTMWGGLYQNGTVFIVTNTGSEAVLHNFTGGLEGDPPCGGLASTSSCADGGTPLASLITSENGDFYGTTDGGGAYGWGTVFKVSNNGRETVLHSFTGYPSDGAGPYGGLVRDDKGNFYGTTCCGGTYGWGTVFKMSENGRETVLYSFTGKADGGMPTGNLVLDATDNLYGTTETGGTGSCNNGFGEGCGVVFEVSVSGAETVLHNFAGYPLDGSNPAAGLMMDKTGNLYGTTQSGGSGSCANPLGDGCGIVFKVSKNGIETVLHNFAGSPSDGGLPYAGVVMDTEGNLYGDTVGGGDYGDGTIYELSRKGALTILYSLDDSGINFTANLIRDAKGNLYGTAWEGGNRADGIVWKLTP